MDSKIKMKRVEDMCVTFDWGAAVYYHKGVLWTRFTSFCRRPDRDAPPTRVDYRYSKPDKKFFRQCDGEYDSLSTKTEALTWISMMEKYVMWDLQCCYFPDGSSPTDMAETLQALQNLKHHYQGIDGNNLAQ